MINVFRNMVRRVIAISGSPLADWAVFNDKVFFNKIIIFIMINIMVFSKRFFTLALIRTFSA